MFAAVSGPLRAAASGNEFLIAGRVAAKAIAGTGEKQIPRSRSTRNGRAERFARDDTRS